MNKEIMHLNIEMVARQRNLFLLLTLVSVLSCFFLTVKIISLEEKVILVPGLHKEVWTNKDGVSASYLEEVTTMYIPFLLDLDSGSIDWKKEKLFLYVSRTDLSYMKSLANYFAEAKRKYAQFSLSTHFAIKNFVVNPKELTVEAHGQLTSHFGKKGVSTDPAIYRFKYEWVSGKLLIKEFVSLVKGNDGLERRAGTEDKKNANILEEAYDVTDE